MVVFWRSALKAKEPAGNAAGSSEVEVSCGGALSLESVLVRLNVSDIRLTRPSTLSKVQYPKQQQQ